MATGTDRLTEAERYEYPMSGRYAETVAHMADGRVLTVDTQYAKVYPRGAHAADCEQVTRMGGQCTCGLLDGIDVAALVADARVRGKRGKRPTTRVAPPRVASEDVRGLCPRCHTWCDGDCTAGEEA